jgi:hypothetical protein
MILRQFEQPDSRQAGAPEPAFQIFLRVQKQVSQPYLPILQPAHSQLAGQLAAALLPDIFGLLPSEVIEAIRQHDYGWISSDLHQLENAGPARLRPFPDMGSEETITTWINSIRLAQTASPLIGVLVSRHFSLLSSDDESTAHRQFRQQEEAWREPMECSLQYPSADLDRWTAAVGFCDLLSLYLCSGAKHAAEFPLCHPADRAARDQAVTTVLRWRGEKIQFVPPVIVAGTYVSQSVVDVHGKTIASLQWTFDGD